ncbi:hypothetical protein MUP65_01730 [Patescibacteria group bacterium]|nr:hypothetical protein [Patescibacteria group bacterium]
MISFAICLTGGLIIFIYWKRLPPEIPLFYSQPWGEAQLSSLNTFFLLPLIGLSTTVLNFLIAKTFFSRSSFASFSLEVGSLVINSLLLVSIIKIISVIL